MKRRRDGNAPARVGWDVVVVPAKEQGDYDYYHGETNPSRPIHGEVAVRLTFDGKTRMTYGIVKITDPAFEDQITTMKAEAAEKAAALQAVGCS